MEEWSVLIVGVDFEYNYRFEAYFKPFWESELVHQLYLRQLFLMLVELNVIDSESLPM